MISPKESGPNGNPYIDSLSSGLIRAGITVDPFSRRKLLQKYDVVHVHWPSALVRWKSRRQAVVDIGKVLTLLSIARRRGARVVWTVHDLAPHEVRFTFLHKFYQRKFIHRVDDLISLTEAAIPLIHESYGGLNRKQIHVIPHGHYRNAYAAVEESPQESRAALGVPTDKDLIVVFGQLRPYKGIDEMINMYGQAQLPNTHLLVIGESKDEAHTAYLRQLVSKTPNASLAVERVPEPKVPRLLNAASVLLANYAEGSSLNSGAALLALSLGRPVVVRDTPVMRELRDAFGGRWVHLAQYNNDVSALASALSAFAHLNGAQPSLSRIDWDEIVLKTAAVYRDRTARIVVVQSQEKVLK